MGKWVGYVDKFLLFPFILIVRWVRACWIYGADVKVHIADHSNAMYAFFLSRASTVVTCHDMLAVRAGLGEDGTACTASVTGRFFQRLIKSGLGRAGKVPCVSSATLSDFNRIVQPACGVGSLLYNALNASFVPLPLESVVSVLAPRLSFEIKCNYLFHVGSSLPRKNRATVVAIFALMRKAGWDGWLVFAGAGNADDIAETVRQNEVGDRVVFLGNVTHGELNALYSGAYALIFPSLSEGFGWPPIEANASGCPVLASNTTALPEICGEGAQLYDPFDIEGFARGTARLADPLIRAEWVRRGFLNVRRFSREAMVDGYVRLYHEGIGLESRRPYI